MEADATPRRIGLDGVYRWSPGENGIPSGISAVWKDEQTLSIDYNSVADIRAYTITAHFTENSLEMTIEQRDEPLAVTLIGRLAKP
jgi:hypothetical protein